MLSGRTGKRRARRVQKYKRTLRPARQAVVEFIYHYCGERHHQGLGNAFLFLVTTGSFAYGVKESVSVAPYSPSWTHSAARSIPDVVARRRAIPTAASTASPRHPSAAPSTTPAATPARNITMDLPCPFHKLELCLLCIHPRAPNLINLRSASTMPA